MSGIVASANGKHGLEPQIAHVQLGRYIYEVVEQPLPVIEDELGEWFGNLTGAAAKAEGDVEEAVKGLSLGGFVSEKAYNLLKAFIPGIMPFHEFRGWSSAAAMAAGEPRDPETRAHAPSGPQVRRALSEGFRVNGIDIWNDVTKLLDPTVAQTILGEAALRLMEGVEQPSPKPSSPATAAIGSMTSTAPPSPTTDAAGSSTGAESESPSPSSGPEASAASPSPVSTLS